MSYPRTIKPLSEKLNRYIIDRKTGCWNWTGPQMRYGYGKISYWHLGHKYTGAASRASYIFHNRITRRLKKEEFVCHKCNNKLCINPHHLYLGTPKDNAADTILAGDHPNKSKTHCSRGHEYTEKNTYYPPKFPTRRLCRKCRNFYSRMAKKRSLYRSRKKAQKRERRFANGEITIGRFNFYNRRADVKARLIDKPDS